MSKKDYVRIAAVLNEELKIPRGLPQLAADLADIFAADNPLFDRARFMAAVTRGTDTGGQ